MTVCRVASRGHLLKGGLAGISSQQGPFNRIFIVQDAHYAEALIHGWRMYYMHSSQSGSPTKRDLLLWKAR